MGVYHKNVWDQRLQGMLGMFTCAVYTDEDRLSQTDWKSVEVLQEDRHAPVVVH